MTGATGTPWRAEVQVYNSRKKISYDLTEDVLDQLIQAARESLNLIAGPPPPAHRIPLCAACSCNPLCWDEE